MEKLDLYYIDLKYIRNLSKKDDNVMSISPQRGKEESPFVGVIVLINGIGYCIPLTSPKDKFKNKKILMQKQLSWCRDNAEVIKNRAQKVYSLVVDTPEKNRNLTKRCSKFKKLEAELEKISK